MSPMSLSEFARRFKEESNARREALNARAAREFGNKRPVSSKMSSAGIPNAKFLRNVNAATFKAFFNRVSAEARRRANAKKKKSPA